MLEEIRQENCLARCIRVNGIVQGVGFRPYVFQLAGRYDLKGEIANTSAGVCLHVEGSRRNIDSFTKELVQNCPPLARITKVTIDPAPVRNLRTFIIARSQEEGTVSTLIAPDVSVCRDCLKELLDPKDRRYRYPFINCTNCGPRYTIIENIPYDRPYTSMRSFRMCRQCQAEYDNPLNRRFHAQPNACPDCGPRVELFDGLKNSIHGEPIEKCIEFLKQGRIVAIKGLGGYHLAVDAENTEAVVRLRRRKAREEKPLAVMSYDRDSISAYAHMDPEEERLLSSWQRPIVLLRKKEPNRISEQVAPRNRNLGVMLPYTPLHYLILLHDFLALVMTSANRSEEPIVIDNNEAFERLAGIADYFLVHNRDIYLRSDDSIVRMVNRGPRLIRRSRGYVPVPLFLKNRIPPILACGAELKNTICLTKGDQAFLSQHIGDLENFQAYESFRMTIEHLKRILQIQPEIIACDLHPDYLSTRYAEEQEGTARFQVQHHHAHVISCLAENRLDGDVIGLSFDGTGYGTDGAVWGGEVLVCNAADFGRAASFSYVPMPGGNAAVKEPWRMGLSYLFEAFGEKIWDLNLPLIRDMERQKIRIILNMMTKHINSPPTSSLGRLFDGIASIMGLRNRVAFEGQAAMEIEMMAGENVTSCYEYAWEKDDYYRIPPGPIIRGVTRDVIDGLNPAEISAKFHNTLIRLFTDLSEVIRRDSHINRVALSGGVFQNSILLPGLTEALEKKGFEVYNHTIVPTNDGGISLGQALVAAAKAGA